jgi:hypothetical protein
MRYLYQKDKQALPGKLQNRRYSLLSPPPPNVVSLTTSPTSLSLSQNPHHFGLHSVQSYVW